VWFDDDFPRILGAELLRPDAQFIAKFVCQPQVVWDATANRGKSVQLDRYDYWEDDSYTKESRRRNPLQTIGTANSRDILKNKIIVTIDEYTGPSGGDPNNPNSPGNFKIPMEAIALAQRVLWQYNPQQIQQFHQSIGALTLFRDYRKWLDRVYINTLLESSFTYNPKGVDDGGTYASGPPKIDVKEDLLTIVEGMRTRNVPTFSDGYYYCLASPRFIKHLRQDSDFRAVAQYPSFTPVAALQPGVGAFAAPAMPAPGMGYVSGPNQLIFGGSQYGQASFMGEAMPTGFVFEGVRFFESNNLPTATVNLNYTASSNNTLHPTGAANRTGNLGIFLGQQAVGEALATELPVSIRLNNNDDYQRFVIAIWATYGGWALLNERFVTVARTYGD
jgi:hypothetical protein